MRLRQHPDVGQAIGHPIAIADAAVALGVVVFQKDNCLVAWDQSPGQRRELIPWRSIRIQLRNVLAGEWDKLVADPLEDELGYVGCAAGAVPDSEIVARSESLTKSGAHLEKEPGERTRFGNQSLVYQRHNPIELRLLNMFCGVDPKSGDAESRQGDEIGRDLLPNGWE